MLQKVDQSHSVHNTLHMIKAFGHTSGYKFLLEPTGFFNETETENQSCYWRELRLYCGKQLMIHCGDRPQLIGDITHSINWSK